MADDTAITSDTEQLRLFKELKEEKTILQMSLAETDLSKLTFVSGVGQKQQGPCFTVGCPAVFARAVRADMERPLVFFFIDKQGVPYTFASSADSVIDDDKGLLLRFPDEIRRNQRRRHVRIKLDSGACLTAWTGDIKYHMSINDISEGGALAMIQESGDPPKQLLSPDEKLLDLRIQLAPGKSDNVAVTVNQAVVRRVAVSAISGRFQYGIMFTDVDDEESQKLKRGLESKYPQKFRRKVKTE